MTGKLRALGLVLFAALAMGAIAAQGTSAHQFTSESNSTILTVENESSHTFSITGTKALTVICTIATATGTQSGTSVDTVTLHPSYASCSSISDPSVETAGCNYIFDSDTTTSTHSSSSEHAAVSIDCETTSSGQHQHNLTISNSGCTIDIGSTHPANTVVNQNLHGVRYGNLPSHAGSGKGAVTFNSTASTILSTTTGNPCSLLGVKEGTYSATITSAFIITGYEHTNPTSGSTTNGFVWSTHGARVDISVD